ncbi:hypothetical protein D6D01_04533 [Aureobasidium pullulans]|uniref:Uncharacterized protein n=1 Tax=Aureobasidium pullulans TaxID=5580 RepID=A0A4S9LC41_AURPU|nr:hypothetical protein D6D01_04533 [Aureobasidium pullulans]
MLLLRWLWRIQLQHIYQEDLDLVKSFYNLETFVSENTTGWLCGSSFVHVDSYKDQGEPWLRKPQLLKFWRFVKRIYCPLSLCFALNQDLAHLPLLSFHHLELSPCVTLTPTPTMSAANDDVVMEGTHNNTDETPEPQTIANNTMTPEQLHEIKKASEEKDKQIASLKLQLRNSRNNVEHQIKDHREATHAHFQSVKDNLDDEIENLTAENDLLSRLLEDKREEFEDKNDRLWLVSEAHARCVGTRCQLIEATHMQGETILRQSNQLMQRRLECEAKDRKILQLTAEIEELVRKGAEPMEEAHANKRKFEEY